MKMSENLDENARFVWIPDKMAKMGGSINPKILRPLIGSWRICGLRGAFSEFVKLKN